MKKKLWGGRFKKSIDPGFERFSSSIKTDYALARFDLIGSYLHVHVLRGAGILSSAEFVKLSGALRAFIDRVEKGNFAFDFSSEDIHTDIQNKLAKTAGSVSAKLQTCRSRNDQVVFASKLYCLVRGLEVREAICEAEKALHKLGGLYDTLIIPGYTHLQHAQPVYFKAYMEAHALMLERDAGRLEDALGRLGISMGSGALAGTPIPSSVYSAQMRKALKALGLGLLAPFISSPKSALATVSDRDFIIEILSAFAILGVHISRLCEDLILWSTKEFGFLELGDEYCTGSSLMPQKKNPDALELLRGASGPLTGNLVSLLTTMKGLPLTYNRDMQWDKAPLFSSFDLAKQVLMILAGLLGTIKVSRENVARQMEDESLCATDLADGLVSQGVAFARAHEIVGQLVRHAADHRKKIRDFSDEELKKFFPKWDRGQVRRCLDPANSVSRKKSLR